MWRLRRQGPLWPVSAPCTARCRPRPIRRRPALPARSAPAGHAGRPPPGAPPRRPRTARGGRGPRRPGPPGRRRRPPGAGP
ncbi:hypothetical protein T261_3779 [Streptomyces lydicus]|nr:hypothetical protein T261_3779 [Streptomyces lydicus]